MDRLRIDKWLWFARLAKSRSFAQRMVESGAVSLNGRTLQKASTELRAGDQVKLSGERLVRHIKVLALGARRGPAVEARLLYVEIAVEPAPPDN